jgi:hypothetical protein
MDKEFERLRALHKSAHIASLILCAKGLIGPSDIRQGGAITPQRARAFISLVYDDGFLQKCTRETMTSLKKEGAVLDIPQRSLRRVAQGSLPADNEKTGVNNYNYILEAEDAQLFMDLTRDFFRDNADNPNLVSELEAIFATRVRGELVDLAFNGTGDPDDGAFLKLNKGFIQQAIDGVPNGQKITIDPATNGWIEELGRVLLAMPEDFLDGAVLHMNTKDAIEYGLEVASHVTGTPQVAQASVSALLDFPVEKVKRMPRGTVLFVQQRNLVFGVNQDIQRTVEVKGRERCTWYTWDMSVDFQIAAKQGAVLARKA